ncbi:DUF4406 domain-containing protein [Campylobacter blaseri]|uniref:Nucleoside 2-deoxyribosyltransferase n=1 Tax=Campylobacter blaseri TaxID=2042961 RepID=A0A2P8R2P6_9BACT|nr:DUF4406 domain-containing protein [Campylobacter blaseri]PSM52773.1 nucleoside 2-deoxyribosyltransferase [Campylobacter blaseri]PSM54421.1 nucleoside 2-deoxyribosyltransferase [Campylobacter blaseri]QKF86086.1 DUF4406 domain-containing protein [Campylobacter blaseri]
MNDRIYIAGAISNNPHFKEEFALAQRYLLNKGYVVLNPAILPKGLSQEEYMRICIPMLNIADTVYFLKGWKKSTGAKIEHALALQAGKRVLYQEEDLRLYVRGWVWKS